MFNIMLDMDAECLRKNTENVSSKFEMIADYFDDEFKLCVLFAYDEYLTTRDYIKNTFYAEFGPKQFEDWISLVIKDEARHYINAVKLIKSNHKHRIHETKDVLRTILDIEESIKEYNHTFLFDHTEENFMLSHEEIKYHVNFVLDSITR